MARYRQCDGITRRNLLQAGLVGGLGLNLASYQRLLAAGALADRPRAKGAIFIMLAGGASHLDTFDMKPESAKEHVRGEFKPISTNLPGLQICEHLPQLARLADHYLLVRGISHTLAAHEFGKKYIYTGNRPTPALEYPAYGSIVCKELPTPPDLPGFVAVNRTQQVPGYLGTRFSPFVVTAPQARRPYRPEGVSLARGMTGDDVHRRDQLLRRLDTAFRGRDGDPLLDGLDEFSTKALSLLTSPRAIDAFQLDKESPQALERFGKHDLGMGCLLACRLIKAGVPFVTLEVGGWDTHVDNFVTLKNTLLPMLDGSLAALLTHLRETGLEDEIAVFVTGEFGRTPTVNERAGRDHWARAMFMLFAGAGYDVGKVVGASDENGEGPTAGNFAPDDMAATFLSVLGIDPHAEYTTSTGRPVEIVRNGTVVNELLKQSPQRVS